MSRRKETCVVCGRRTPERNSRSVRQEIPIAPGISLWIDGLVCKWEFGSEEAWETWGEDVGLKEDFAELAEDLRTVFWVFFRCPVDLFGPREGEPVEPKLE